MTSKLPDWMYELRRLNIKPTLTILDDAIHPSEAWQAEQDVIEVFRNSRGDACLNLATSSYPRSRRSQSRS
jgi:hypothetical protein